MSVIRVLPERDMWLPGETVLGTVELHVDKPLRARGVRVRLRGYEETRVTHGSGKSRHTHREHRDLLDWEETFVGEDRISDALEGFSDAVRALFGGGEYLRIPVGKRRFDFQVTLPDGCQVSYEGEHAKVVYELLAYVDVPAGLDVRDERTLYVLAPPVGEPGRRPCVGDYPGANDHWGVFEGLRAALAPDIRMRVQLASEAFLVGEEIRGTLAVWNESGARIRHVEISLIAQEDATAGHASARSITAHAREELPSPVMRDFSAEFALKIPPNAHPTMAGAFFTYNWGVKVRLDIPWQFDVVSVLPIGVFAAARD
ncbi:MAG: arrestin family protein [Armatimonadota bacterium]